MNKILIKQLKQMKTARTQLSETVQQREQLIKNKELVSPETYEALLGKHESVIRRCEDKIREAEKNAELRLTEIQLMMQDNKEKCEETEKQMKETQLLFDNMALSKADFGKQRRSLSANIRRFSSNLKKLNKEKAEIEFLTSSNGSIEARSDIRGICADKVGVCMDFIRDHYALCISAVLVVTVCAVSLFIFTAHVNAVDVEKEVLQIRRLYNETQTKMNSYQFFRQTEPNYAGMACNLDFYSTNDGDVRLIMSTWANESGYENAEFYYHDNALYFAYIIASAGRMPRQENRYYFKNGKMIRWLVGQEEAEVLRSDDSFKEKSKQIWKQGEELRSKYQEPRMGPRE